MTVLATVISATHADRVTVDAGFKAFSTDRPFGPGPSIHPSGATNGQATNSATFPRTIADSDWAIACDSFRRTATPPSTSTTAFTSAAAISRGCVARHGSSTS